MISPSPRIELKWLGAILIGVLAAQPALADVGIPFPFTKRAGLIHVQVEALESYSDYVFVLFHDGRQYDDANKSWSLFSGTEFVELTLEHPLMLDLNCAPPPSSPNMPRASERATLMAVPKPLATKYKSAKDLREAILAGNAPRVGIVEKGFDVQETVPSWSSNTTITYLVQRTSSEESLEFIRTSGDPIRVVRIAGILMAVGMLAAGFWLARFVARRRSSKSKTQI